MYSEAQHNTGCQHDPVPPLPPISLARGALRDRGRETETQGAEAETGTGQQRQRGLPKELFLATGFFLFLLAEGDHCLTVDGAMQKEGFAEDVGQLALAQVL